jgi:hypothetical protein
VICGTTRGYVICGANGGYVICGVGGVEDVLLWRSDMIDSIPEVGLGCFGVFIMEKVKDMMVSIAGGWEYTAWCDLLL